MSQALQRMLRTLDLEGLGADLFRGTSPDPDRRRVFGGQVTAQALVAAGRTAPRGRLHSAHGCFLRTGDPKTPLLFEVERLRDGRAFSIRCVRAVQHDRTIFHLVASFHVDEAGYDYHAPMPAVPPPEDLPTLSERVRRFSNRLGSWVERERPIDLRYCEPADRPPGQWREPDAQVWLRTVGPLPDDPMLHACVLAYASDMTLLDVTLRPHGLAWSPEDRVRMASLDHSLWFHRPFRADDWLLYAQATPSSCGARGFATAHVFTRAGRLVASVAQEGLIRPVLRDEDCVLSAED